MAKKTKTPVTPAVRALRAAGIEHTVHLYRYEAGSGALGGAIALGLDPHAVVKTLIMEDDTGSPIVVLMHGDRQVSTKQLARHLGARSVAPCTPERAERHTGYQVGGTSPFGLRTEMPVMMERSILDNDRIYLNGGKRGFLVGVSPSDVAAALAATLVDTAIG